MLTKEQENILQWLLCQKRNTDNSVTISNSMSEYLEGYTDKEIIQKLNELENLELLNIKWISNNHSNLNAYITIKLSREALTYFDNKKNENKENRRRWIETYGAIIISFIALLKSFDKELIWLWKQLMQLLQQLMES